MRLWVILYKSKADFLQWNSTIFWHHCLCCRVQPCLSGIYFRLSSEIVKTTSIANYKTVSNRFHSPKPSGSRGTEVERWTPHDVLYFETIRKLRKHADSSRWYECDIVWEIASKLYTREMVSINLLFDGSIIKRFAKF